MIFETFTLQVSEKKRIIKFWNRKKFKCLWIFSYFIKWWLNTFMELGVMKSRKFLREWFINRTQRWILCSVFTITQEVVICVSPLEQYSWLSEIYFSASLSMLNEYVKIYVAFQGVIWKPQIVLNIYFSFNIKNWLLDTTNQWLGFNLFYLISL